jgi:hypothetical protein
LLICAQNICQKGNKNNIARHAVPVSKYEKAAVEELK